MASFLSFVVVLAATLLVLFFYHAALSGVVCALFAGTVSSFFCLSVFVRDGTKT